VYVYLSSHFRYVLPADRRFQYPPDQRRLIFAGKELELSRITTSRRSRRALR
jgi:hypothetical protein